jgi:hypothetical protein
MFSNSNFFLDFSLFSISPYLIRNQWFHCEYPYHIHAGDIDRPNITHLSWKGEREEKVMTEDSVANQMLNASNYSMYKYLIQLVEWWNINVYIDFHIFQGIGKRSNTMKPEDVFTTTELCSSNYDMSCDANMNEKETYQRKVETFRRRIHFCFADGEIFSNDVSMHNVAVENLVDKCVELDSGDWLFTWVMQGCVGDVSAAYEKAKRAKMSTATTTESKQNDAVPVDLA